MNIRLSRGWPGLNVASWKLALVRGLLGLCRGWLAWSVIKAFQSTVELSRGWAGDNEGICTQTKKILVISKTQSSCKMPPNRETRLESRTNLFAKILISFRKRNQIVGKKFWWKFLKKFMKNFIQITGELFGEFLQVLLGQVVVSHVDAGEKNLLCDVPSVPPG